MRTHLIACILVLFALSSAAPAASTLHIGFGAGTTCAQGCGGHPNTSPGYALSASFNIFNNSNGQSMAQQPVLLILGVAGYQDPITDPGRFTKNSITNVSTYSPYNPSNLSNAVTHPSTAWTYGSTAFGVHGTQTAGSGYQGFFRSGDAYSFLNLGGAGVNNSQSFGNWNAGIAAAYPGSNLRPLGYEMYVFGLNVPLNGKGLINIDMATDPITGKSVVPAKSYILAYTRDQNGKPLVVPFTEAGLQTPEPSATLLMFTVAGAIVYLLRRRRRSTSVAETRAG